YWRNRSLIYIFPASIRQTDIQRTFRTLNYDIVNRHAIHYSTIHHLQRNSRNTAWSRFYNAVPFIATRFNNTIRNDNILISSGRFGATLYSIGKAADNTIINNDIFTRSQSRTFQHDSVIVRIDDTIRQDKPATTVNIYTVII